MKEEEAGKKSQRKGNKRERRAKEVIGAHEKGLWERTKEKAALFPYFF